jgi:hypothetical protein
MGGGPGIGVLPAATAPPDLPRLHGPLPPLSGSGTGPDSSKDGDGPSDLLAREGLLALQRRPSSDGGSGLLRCHDNHGGCRKPCAPGRCPDGLQAVPHKPAASLGRTSRKMQAFKSEAGLAQIVNILPAQAHFKIHQNIHELFGGY